MSAAAQIPVINWNNTNNKKKTFCYCRRTDGWILVFASKYCKRCCNYACFSETNLAHQQQKNKTSEKRVLLIMPAKFQYKTKKLRGN